MARASCVIRLNDNQIDGDNVSCTGTQLVLILETIREETSNCRWYTADIEPLVYGTTPGPMLSDVPFLVGSTSDLIDVAKKVDQFLFGVFIAVPGKEEPGEWWRLFYTEDDPFEEMGLALYEIRAFDTSYYEVYVQSDKLLKGLANRFNGEIEFAANTD